MKKLTFFMGFLVYLCQPIYSQAVGINTSSPNTKSILDISSPDRGVLLPRMTQAQREAMDDNFTDAEIGMMVFQTAPYKGIYTFQGVNGTAREWVGLPSVITGGSGNTDVNGATLKFDGTSWIATLNLFNQGNSIGIGTQSPKSQLHINSIAPQTQFRLTAFDASTNSGTGVLKTDGVLLGISQSSGEAFLKQYEKKALWFATDSLERMRIDSVGNVGVNETNPQANLDVNGSVKVDGSLDINGVMKVGPQGSLIYNIIHTSVMIDIPSIASMTTCPMDIAVSNATPTATIQITPGDNLGDVMIGYARVLSPGLVQVKFMNMGITVDPPPMQFYLTIIK